MKNRIQLKISLIVFKRKKRNRIRKEMIIAARVMMFKGQIMLKNLKIRRKGVIWRKKKRKVIKNLNTIIEETRSLKRKNKRRSKERDRIAIAMNQAKKKVMVHRKMFPDLKKSNKRKRNSSKMTKENS